MFHMIPSPATGVFPTNRPCTNYGEEQDAVKAPINRGVSILNVLDGQQDTAQVHWALSPVDEH